MKRILYILALIISGSAFGQYPVTSNIGGDSVLTNAKGGFLARLVNVNFLDTNAANLTRIRQYSGAQIVTTSGGNNVFVRNSTATRWILVGGTSGIGGNVTQVTSGNLNPLFNVTVNTNTTTPEFVFAQQNVAENTYFGRLSATGVPSFIPASDMPLPCSPTVSQISSTQISITKCPSGESDTITVSSGVNNFYFYNDTTLIVVYTTTLICDTIFDADPALPDSIICIKVQVNDTIPLGGNTTGYVFQNGLQPVSPFIIEQGGYFNRNTRISGRSLYSFYYDSLNFTTRGTFGIGPRVDTLFDSQFSFLPAKGALVAGYFKTFGNVGQSYDSVGPFTVSLQVNNKVIGNYSYSSGISNYVTGYVNTVSGEGNQALGNRSFVTGQSNTLNSNSYNSAMIGGIENLAWNHYGLTAGFHNQNYTYGGTVVGVYNDTIHSKARQVLGYNGVYDTQGEGFSVGNGTGVGALRSNSLTLFNGGNLVIGGATYKAGVSIDLPSTTKAFGINRGATANMLSVASPFDGLLYWNTDSLALCEYTSSVWRKVDRAGTAGSGTVTSVNVSGGSTGLTASGGPITIAGTITLGGTLITSNGGTGLSSYTQGDIVYYNSGTTLSKLAIGTTGQALTVSAGGIPVWTTLGGGSGTVTSVASGYGISGGTITTTGTLLMDTATVFTKIFTTLALTTTGTAGAATWTPATRILNIPQYQQAGTYVTSVTGTTNRITSTGGTTPVIDIASTYVGQASITTVGTITTGVWNGTTIAVANGGTGLTSATTGDVLYASATNVWSRLGIGTTGQALTVSAGGIPTWTTLGAGSGTVTSVATGYGVTGGTITTTGTIVVDTATLFTKLFTTFALTTLGGSGAATWDAGTRTLNVPQYTGGGGGSVTEVFGTTNRITVATGTTTPVVDISSNYVGQASITTLGTITTGVWNGTDIAFANIAQLPTVTLAGNSTGGTADIQPITLATGLSFVGTVLTPADASATNELQVFANTSNATSHTNTLSQSGGSIQYIEGYGALLTTGGTGLNGTLTLHLDSATLFSNLYSTFLLTTTGTSGASTWNATTRTLNVPQYSGGGGGTPGGSNTEVQYNNAGSFGGITGFTSSGTNVTAGSGNLIATRPKFITSIDDTNGNEVFKITASASAVNEITIANAAAGNWPLFTASGSDTDIGLSFLSKNDGAFSILGNAGGYPGQLRIYERTSDGTNFTAFKATTQSGDITYTLPNALPGTNSTILGVTTAGVLQWIEPGGTPGISVPINNIVSATGSGGGQHGNYNILWDWNGLTGGYGLEFTSSSTANVTGSTTVVIHQQGLNSNAGVMTAAAYINNEKTGTGAINYALQLDAIGGLKNIALSTWRGNVGIGNLDPLELLSVGSTSLYTAKISMSGITSGKVILQVADAAGTWTGTLPTDDGTSGQALITNGSGVMSWATISGGTITLAAIGSTPNANAATITGTVLNLEPADATFGGVVKSGTQTFPTGIKTFQSDIVVNGHKIGLSGGQVATNIAVGSGALLFNTTGAANLAVGLNALFFNTTGTENTALGKEALYNNTTGANNLGVGISAARANTTGNSNVAIGYGALLSNQTGSTNTAVGNSAISGGGTYSYANTAVGFAAMNAVTTGEQNSALGVNALLVLTTGIKNVAIGAAAMEETTTGYQNVAVGMDAQLHQTTGWGNIGIGWLGGSLNATGDGNIHVGWSAGRNAMNGNENISIGHSSMYLDLSAANSQLQGASNSIAIGAYTFTTADNQIVIGNTNHTATYLRGTMFFNGSPGTSGQILMSQGSSLPPFWAAAGVGTVTSVSAGSGMDFPTITGSGAVVMGTPSSVTASSTNSVTANSHTHAIVSSWWNLAGNSGTTASVNFIGTTDAVDFVIRANNTERFRALSAGGNETQRLIIKTTGENDYQIKHRIGLGLGFPVATVMPGATPNNMAFNIGPYGSPGDYSNNGIAWLHITDTDVSGGAGTTNTAVLGISTTYAEVGVRNFGGTSKPFRIVVNADTRMNFSDAANTADFSIGKITQSQSISGDYVGYSLWNTNNTVAESNPIFFIGQDFASGRDGFFRWNNNATSSGYRKPNQLEIVANNGATGGLALAAMGIGSKLSLVTSPDGGSTHFERMTIDNDGHVSIGVTTATAMLHLKAGTATAGTAPLKLNTGTALTATEDGAMEYHGSHLYFTIGSTRYQLDQQGGGGGTVTSVATGYGLSGGTITTTGTLIADTATLFTKVFTTLALTTTGTSGAATWNAATRILNIPQYAAGTGTVTNFIFTDANGFDGTVTTSTTTPTLALTTTMTTGSVIFAAASGAISQDNTKLFWDNTCKCLGIGTNTPSYPLHVTGDNTEGAVAFIENTTGRGLLVEGDGTSLFAVTKNTAQRFEVGGGGTIYINGNAGTSGQILKSGGGDPAPPVWTSTVDNLRVNPRIQTTATSASITINSDITDQYTFTALASNLTINATSGTPVDGQRLILRILDNGSARTLTFNAIFRASTDLPLPSTTIASKTLYLQFLYNSAAAKWDLIQYLNNF